MTLLWCSTKFGQLYKLSLCNKINIQPFLVDNIAPLVVNIYLGLRPWEIFLPWVQYLSIFHAEGWNIYNIYLYIYMYIRIAFSIELRLRVSRSLANESLIMFSYSSFSSSSSFFFFFFGWEVGRIVSRVFRPFYSSPTTRCWQTSATCGGTTGTSVTTGTVW